MSQTAKILPLLTLDLLHLTELLNPVRTSGSTSNPASALKLFPVPGPADGTDFIPTDDDLTVRAQNARKSANILMFAVCSTVSYCGLLKLLHSF